MSAKEKKNRERERPADGTARKTSWGWLLGSDDKDKEAAKRDKEEKDAAKKAKAKAAKVGAPAPQEAARLDLLQTVATTDEPHGRESLVLDRSAFPKELSSAAISSRKRSNSNTAAKEGPKDGSTSSTTTTLLSTLFGSRKKSDRDLKKQAVAASATAAAAASAGRLALPYATQLRLLRPDVDYNWTRFSILEERTIYRMAHMKLANPRRALLSQVLLSNFMYSYLAKVQSMHMPGARQHMGDMRQTQMAQQQHYYRQQQQPQNQQYPDDHDRNADHGYLEWQLYQNVSGLAVKAKFLAS